MSAIPTGRFAVGEIVELKSGSPDIPF